MPSRAAEWQWSVPVSPGRADDLSRAFLWIPPTCKSVRGVVLGQHNMEEIGVFEHPSFRKTLAELGFAEVWVALTDEQGLTESGGGVGHCTPPF